MKQENDAQLIDDILSGDTAAFNTLVERYQKSVHALVWRKIGDFHYAEEITQDTFLQAYKKLSTLKNPNLFAGWLYVIANRLSIKWLREQKPVPQSLETIPVNEIEIGGNGIYRTTDAGDSWHLFMDGIIGTGIRSLVAFNNGLCAYTGKDIVQSTDGGESWKKIPVDADDSFMLSYGSKLTVRDGELYGIASEVKNFRIFGLSADGNTLVPREKTPAFDEEMGQRPVIDMFAVDGTTVYGAGSASIYRLGSHGKWEQVSPSVPGKVVSLAINNNRLYVVTGRRGLFHISLDEKFHNASINE